jgi:tryptophan synthase alpha chain
MTNRIVARFDELRARGEAALIAYLTAGDPSLDESAPLVLEAAAGGADVIELGVPWSDPSADGPVIQRAMERALSTGGAGRQTIARVLEVVRAVRRASEVPIVLFGYFNPLLQRGLDRIADEARDAGVDGLLVVDLPPEESGELDAHVARAGLVRVPLLAPTTSPERARLVAARGGGFAYYVALTGVTGAATLDPAAVGGRVAALRPSLGGLPLAVGFGVRDAASAGAVAALAGVDGVVVGSALVSAIAAAPDAAARRRVARERCAELKAAVASRGARTGA